MKNCKDCELVREAGVGSTCPRCMRDKMLKTMPYFKVVLEKMEQKYQFGMEDSLFDILEMMSEEDREEMKMAMKYPKGKLRIVH